MANKRRPQGDGTIRKRNDGRWEARIIIGHKNDGSPMYKSAFAKTQKSALKELHQLIELYRDVELTEECRMTLGEWLDKWLDECHSAFFGELNVTVQLYELMQFLQRTFLRFGKGGFIHG